MLDRRSLHQLLATRAISFVDDRPLISRLTALWQAFIADPSKVYGDARTPLAQYDAQLSPQNMQVDIVEPVTIIGVDGSQIYPDRHEGTMLGLVQTAAVAITYQRPTSTMVIHEKVQLVDGIVEGNEASIDAIRHAAEFAAAIESAQQYANSVVLLDGALLAWHAQEYAQRRREQIMEALLTAMRELYSQNIAHVAYTSSPNTKEILQILSSLAAQQGIELPSHQLVDAQLLAHVLQQGQVTPWFCSVSTGIATEYPAELRPWFCYMHTGNEIARIEAPAWLIQDNEKMMLVVQALLQQIKLGRGFPVVLAEAHAATVITAADRAYFYQAIEQASGGQLNTVSSKLQAKRRMTF